MVNLRGELLNCEIFNIFLQVKALIKKWCMKYNEIYPNRSFGYFPPVPETVEA